MNRLLDSHVHFWDPAARHHDWLAEEARLNAPFLPSGLEVMDGSPDGVIFIEADCRPGEAADEVSWVASLADAGAPILGIVAHAQIELPDELSRFLGTVAQEPLVVGVRRLLQHEPAGVFDEPTLIEGHRSLARHDLTSDICITAEQIPAAAALIGACPDTTFVLDHVGKPDVASGKLEPWRSDLKRLASLPNVSCKLSGLATQTPHQSWPRDVLPYLLGAIELFGPSRCMFASDWPVLELNGSYEAWLRVVDDATADLTTDERAGIFSENAARVYGLKGTQRPRRDT